MKRVKKKLHGLGQEIKQTLKKVGKQYKKHLTIINQKREETSDRKIWEDILKFEETKYIQEQAVLEEALSLVPVELRGVIQEEIDDYGYTENFKIVETKNGRCPMSGLRYQANRPFDIWVDQYRNGGITGNDFAGEIYIRLTDNKFLNFHYSM